jgi:hypothetical protein
MSRPSPRRPDTRTPGITRRRPPTEPPVALSVDELERAADIARRMALATASVPVATSADVEYVRDVEARARQIVRWLMRLERAGGARATPLGMATCRFVLRAHGKQQWPRPPAPALSRGPTT